MASRSIQAVAAVNTTSARGHAMATNEPDGSAIILINVFEVDPDRVEAFFSGWRERAELMCKREGFRSLRLHRAIGSDTHFQIINIAQWDSEAALKAAMAQQDWRGRYAKTRSSQTLRPMLRGVVGGGCLV